MEQTSIQHGQVALVVLLVLTISLTIGLSLIARTVSELRATSNAEKSSQAYAAAEAGIESAIRENVTTSGSQTTIGPNGEQATYQITNVQTQGGKAGVYELPKAVDQNEATQIWLFDYDSFINPDISNLGFPSNLNSINVLWGTVGQESDSSKQPALEASLISANYSGSGKSLSAFSLTKFAFDPLSQAARGATNNFDHTASTCSTTANGKTYLYCQTIALTSGSNKSLLLRLKLIYNTKKHDIAIDSGSAILPAQGKLIDSEGSSGNVTRKLRVFQSFPTLPGIFDFVLFNGSSTPLEK